MYIVFILLCQKKPKTTDKYQRAETSINLIPILFIQECPLSCLHNFVTVSYSLLYMNQVPADCFFRVIDL